MATQAPPRPGAALIDSSDSDDDAPLAARIPSTAIPKPSAPSSAPPATQTANGSSAPGPSQPAPIANPPALKKDDTDSEDDVPLAARQKPAVLQPAAAPKKPVLDDAAELLSAPKPKPKPVASKHVVAAKPAESSDSEDDMPLAQRRVQSAASGKFQNKSQISTPPFNSSLFPPFLNNSLLHYF
jgi:hypothetical protein